MFLLDTARPGLSACEAAAELAELLKAEALTPEGQMDVYNATRRFLEALKSPEFENQQTSHWAILKFHMLLHIVNLLDAKRLAHEILQARGGAAAQSLALAARIPARRHLTAVCDAANNGPDVLKPVDRDELPGADVVAAVRGDWAAATGCDAATTAAADFEGSAEWFRTLLLRNIEERFVAPVDVNEVVEVNPRFMSVPETGVERVRESPALAILARVAAIFYMRPPAEGQAGDGLPLPVLAPGGEPAPRMQQRMFAVLHLFRVQSSPHRDALSQLGLCRHAICHPKVAVPGEKALRVVPLTAVLRGVRAFPVQWPLGPPGASAARAYGRSLAAQRIGHLQKAARCEEDGILVFFPRTRHTWLPGGAVPQRPEGANEEEEDGNAAGLA